MKLTDEDLKLFNDKLLNDYSKEQLDVLSGISVEEIREYIKYKPITSAANGDYNVVYGNMYPILDDIKGKLENKVDICVPCEIKAVLKYLFREIILPYIWSEAFGINIDGDNKKDK